MIDIESKVYNDVVTAVEAEYPDAGFASVYVQDVPQLPFVSFYEGDNAAYQRSVTNTCLENHARIMFECNVYAAKKAAAKAIAAIVDDKMQQFGFHRSFKGETPNMDDRIFRITLRWTGIVSKGITDGDTTTHIVYGG